MSATNDARWWPSMSRIMAPDVDLVLDGGDNELCARCAGPDVEEVSSAFPPAGAAPSVAGPCEGVPVACPPAAADGLSAAPPAAGPVTDEWIVYEATEPEVVSMHRAFNADPGGERGPMVGEVSACVGAGTSSEHRVSVRMVFEGELSFVPGRGGLLHAVSTDALAFIHDPGFAVELASAIEPVSYEVIEVDGQLVEWVSCLACGSFVDSADEASWVADEGGVLCGWCAS